MSKFKQWGLMTNEEIEQIQADICRANKCQYLRHMGGVADGPYYCNYICDVGHPRGCRPEECEHWKDEKRRKRQKFTNKPCF